MKISRKAWIIFLCSFFILFFLTPGYYIFNLHKISGGFFLDVHHIVLMIFAGVFLLLPFFQTVLFFKRGAVYYGLLCVAGGVVAPILAGIVIIIVVYIRQSKGQQLS